MAIQITISLCTFIWLEKKKKVNLLQYAHYRITVILNRLDRKGFKAEYNFSLMFITRFAFECHSLEIKDVQKFCIQCTFRMLHIVINLLQMLLKFEMLMCCCFFFSLFIASSLGRSFLLILLSQKRAG